MKAMWPVVGMRHRLPDMATSRPKIRQFIFAIPGDLETRTGGYGYAREIIDHLPGSGWAANILPLDASFPQPSPAVIDASMQALRAMPEDQPIMVDGLAYGVLPATLLADIPNPLIALVHHPLGLETGLDPIVAKQLLDSERSALAVADTIIVTSPHTKRVLIKQFGISGRRIHVATPGIPAGKRAEPDTTQPPIILSVGTITKRKGTDILLACLLGLTDIPWHAVICGDHGRDPQYAEFIKTVASVPALAGRITFTGSVGEADLHGYYDQASLFVLPSHYEGYGMAFAEAVRRGIPALGFATGAVPDTVGKGGILVPDGDANALSDAMAALLTNPKQRQNLSDQAWAFGQTMPDWFDTADIIGQCLTDAAEA
jgi:glycosyltransferase involved in cell wall biosynthesis